MTSGMVARAALVLVCWLGTFGLGFGQCVHGRDPNASGDVWCVHAARRTPQRAGGARARLNAYADRFERGVQTFTIYFNTEYYPGKYLVRGWKSYMNHSEPDEEYKVLDSLEEARGAIPAGFVWQARHPQDDTTIVECWI